MYQLCCEPQAGAALALRRFEDPLSTLIQYNKARADLGVDPEIRKDGRPISPLCLIGEALRHAEAKLGGR